MSINNNNEKNKMLNVCKSFYIGIWSNFVTLLTSDLCSESLKTSELNEIIPFH